MGEAAEQITRTIGRPFQKGQSGNPRGRPPGIAKKIRELAGGSDGATLARFWLAGMNGRLPNPEYVSETETPGVKAFIAVDVRDRLLCSKMLVERGWGKPPQYAPIEDDDPLDLTDDEADEMAADLDARMGELEQRRLARDEAAAAAQEADA